MLLAGPSSVGSAITIVSSTSLRMRFMWPSYAYQTKHVIQYDPAALCNQKAQRTCRIPVNSRSPRSFTKTRSLSERRIRSKGSWMPDEDESIFVLRKLVLTQSERDLHARASRAESLRWSREQGLSSDRIDRDAFAASLRSPLLVQDLRHSSFFILSFRQHAGECPPQLVVILFR